MMDAKTITLAAVMGALLAVITFLLGPQWAAATHLPGGVLIIPVSAATVVTVLMLGARLGAALTLTTWAFLLAPTPAIGFAPGFHKLIPALVTGLVDDALWPMLPKGRRALIIGGVHTAVMWVTVAASFAFFGLPALKFIQNPVFPVLAAVDVAAGSLVSGLICREVTKRIGRGSC